MLPDITSQIYDQIAFSLYSSLLSVRYFELGRSNKVRHRFRLFFKRTILLLIHHQFLQFCTNVLRRLPFITLSAIFPQIAAATHGKRTKSTISSNPQSSDGGLIDYEIQPIGKNRCDLANYNRFTHFMPRKEIQEHLFFFPLCLHCQVALVCI